MKKHLLLLLLSIVLLPSQMAAEAYAVWCEGNTTLYFLASDSQVKPGDSYKGQAVTNVWSGNDVTASQYVSNDNPDETQPRWLPVVSETVTQVVIDPSFSSVRPSSTAAWFLGFKLMEEVSGLEYLNTSQVTDMSSMFGGCEKLSRLDLSHFDTPMLKSMFVMFADCFALEILDLSSFNTSQVTNMSNIFQRCRSLKTIYIGSNWTTANVKYDNAMFFGCVSLMGSDGTKVTYENMGKNSAHGGAGGYLILKDGSYLIPHALWCEGNATLYFVGTPTELKVGDTYQGQTITAAWRGSDITASPDFSTRRMYPTYPAWLKTVCKKVKHVVFDESMRSTTITQMGGWFKDCELLEDVTGLEYLNTSKVKSMSGLFYGCQNLTAADVSHFETSNVTDMSGMFEACLKLRVLDLSSFDTKLVAHAIWMFASCWKLRTIYIGEAWDLSHVEELGGKDSGYGIFYQCDELVGQDGTKAHDSDIKNYTRAHAGAGGFMTMKTSGTEVTPDVPYVVYDKSTRTLTFYYDKNEAARDGIYYDPDAERKCWAGYKYYQEIDHVVFDPSFANYTGVTSTAHWFDGFFISDITGLEYLNTSNVTDMSYMFNECIALNTIDVSHFDTRKVKNMSHMFDTGYSPHNTRGIRTLDLSNFDTSNVEDMSYMFGGRYLTDIDVSHFDTRKVKDMSYMFHGCNGLETIDVSNFDISNVKNMSYMFNYCENLKTIHCENTWNINGQSDNMFNECPNLPGWSTSNANDIRFAKPRSQGGYFTSAANPQAELDAAKESVAAILDDIEGVYNELHVHAKAELQNEKLKEIEAMAYELMSRYETTKAKIDKQKVFIEPDKSSQVNNQLLELKANIDKLFAVTEIVKEEVAVLELMATTMLSQYREKLTAATTLDEVESLLSLIKQNGKYDYAWPGTADKFKSQTDNLINANENHINDLNLHIDSCFKLLTDIELVYTFGDGKLIYTATSATTVTVSSQIAHQGELTIPETVVRASDGKTFTVTAIANGGFYSYGLTAVTLPSTLESIGTNAFGNCKALTSVTVGNSTPVAINSGSFTNRRNATLYVPAGSKAAYMAADYWNEFAQIIEVGEPPVDLDALKSEIAQRIADLQETVGKQQLAEEADKLAARLYSLQEEITKLTQKWTTVSNRMASETISDDAVSQAVEKIKKRLRITGTFTFDGLNTEVKNLMTRQTDDIQLAISMLQQKLSVLPTCEQQLSKAESEDDLQAITETLDDFEYQLNGEAYLVTIAKIASALSESEDAMMLCDDELKKLEEALDNNLALTEFTSSKGLTYAPTSTTEVTVRAANTGLTGSVAIPEVARNTKTNRSYTVTAIAPDAFSGCSAITQLTIAKSVTAIGANAFAGCTGLETIEVLAGSTAYTVADGALYTADLQTLVAVPAKTSGSFTLPESVTAMVDGAFNGCALLTELNVSQDSPVSVGSSMFDGMDFEACRLVVPYGTAATYRAANGWNRFVHISGEQTIEVDGNKIAVTDEGNVVFRSADPLTAKGDYTIPETIEVNGQQMPVTEIADGAFENCTGMTSCTIPEGVTKIGKHPFRGCNMLEELHVLSPLPIDLNELMEARRLLARSLGIEVPEALEGIDFDRCVLYVPFGYEQAYREAKGWSLFKHIVGVHGESDPALTVTAKSYTREYGEENPAFEFSTEGATLDGEPVIECAATAASPVGTYDIVVKKGGVRNYNDTYVNATLTITKAPLTVKAGSYSRKQGEQDPEFTVTYEGFKNGETETVLTKLPVVAVEATPESEPGKYVITLSGAEADNYDITYTEGELTVTEADPITIMAKSYTREYGEENPAFEFTTEGATLDGEPVIECAATAASPVGTYDIVVKKGGVRNYNDTYVNATLTITKAPLTVKVGSYSRKQGEQNPEFAVTYEGFKNGETEAVLTKLPAVAVEATPESELGKYAITISGAEADNYEITYIKGELTVTEADPITIMAKSYTREYGEENPAFEFTTKGAALDGEPVIECAATAASPAGTYDIVIKKGGVRNYNDTYVNATLTITKAPLTITVADAEREQGEENPEFVITYSGWKNGDTESVLTKKATAATEAAKESPVGEYAIVLGGGEADNYELVYVEGKLTVTVPSAIAELTANGAFDVYDVRGRKIRHQVTTLKGLPKGVYIVRGKKVVVGK